ncbi:hypothetical protein [Haladaptatus sp. NG-SE-30]
MSDASTPEPSDQSFDTGMELCGRLDSEEELQEWLKEFFESRGWTAIREVTPHGSNYKADLIVEHEAFGWVGIETKYFRNDGGGKAAKAHHQITRRYRGEKYIGKKIDLWAVCPYFWGINSQDPEYQQDRIRSVFMREFFGHHGIGYINLNRPTLLIDYAYSDSKQKIPVGGDYLSQYFESVDIEYIRERVQAKRREYDYR